MTENEIGSKHVKAVSSIANGQSVRSDFPWWHGACLYQVYPRSFLDSNDDGIGDLPGITKGLDYIAALGVDAIWLSPFFTSPMRDFGYDVSDYCDVDPVFGTLDDFDQLIASAHLLNLKIIIDQVYSHTSDQHAWFAQSRRDANNSKSDWYVWADAKPDGTPPNNWQSVFGGPAWTWDARRGQYYFHNFLESQPDLNLHNPAVQNALLDVTRFWLDRGVDGFRLDAINFAMHDPQLRDNPIADLGERQPTRPFDFQQHTYNQSHPDIAKFLTRVRDVMNAYSDRFSVAEVAGPNPLSEMKAFTANDRHLHSAYNFDFLYAEKMSPTLIRRSLTAWSDAAGEGWPSWAFSNHDAPRAVSRWSDHAQRKAAAEFYALLLVSLRGNIFFYQGEELGLPQADVGFEDLQDPEAIANWPLTLGRDGARTPVPWDGAKPNAGFSAAKPWLPVDPRHHDLAIKTQSNRAQSTLSRISSFIQMRRQSPTLRHGSIEFFDSDNEQLLIFRRFTADQTLLCLFNMGEKTVEIDEWIAGFTSVLASSGIDRKEALKHPFLPSLSGIIVS